MKPFFCYYGGKFRAAPAYPKPKYDTIIEPFAGAAGYSLRYHTKKIVLYDIDPIICGLWDYLIHVSAAEIRNLPLAVEHVDNHDIPPPAKHLIGFWLNKGTSRPCKRPSAWVRGGTRPNSVWGAAIRERVASQLEGIRHWSVSNLPYDAIPDAEATWFVDPPYQGACGREYKYNVVNFSRLAEWVKSRNGQVIVCEQSGADWLNFRPFRILRAGAKIYSSEVIYTTPPKLVKK